MKRSKKYFHQPYWVGILPPLTLLFGAILIITYGMVGTLLPLGMVLLFAAASTIEYRVKNPKRKDPGVRIEISRNRVSSRYIYTKTRTTDVERFLLR